MSETPKPVTGDDAINWLSQRTGAAIVRLRRILVEPPNGRIPSSGPIEISFGDGVTAWLSADDGRSMLKLVPDEWSASGGDPLSPSAFDVSSRLPYSPLIGRQVAAVYPITGSEPGRIIGVRVATTDWEIHAAIEVGGIEISIW